MAAVTALDLSADVGLAAVLLATANVGLGVLMAARYDPRRRWPHRRVNLFAVHNLTAYLLLAAVLLHPLLLLAAPSPRWRLLDLALPIWSPVQPLVNTLGAASAYLVVVVVVTSYFRLRLGRRRWKLFHYLAYAAATGVFLHGILADPELRRAAVDPLDGEKLFVEACLLLTVLATAWRSARRRRIDRGE